MGESRADTYPCRELLDFWAGEPGGWASMPPQIWLHIANNRGEWAPWPETEDVRDRTQTEIPDEQAPF